MLKLEKEQGFTLIELIVVISVLALLVTTGMTVFYRSLRGSSRVEVQKVLETEVQHVVNNMMRLIRDSEVISVNGSDREACFLAGAVTGVQLEIEDLWGYRTLFSLDDGRVASNSSYLSSDNVQINGLTFEWNCADGGFDSLEVDFGASALGDDGSATAVGDYGFDLLIRNSVN